MIEILHPRPHTHLSIMSETETTQLGVLQFSCHIWSVHLTRARHVASLCTMSTATRRSQAGPRPCLIRLYNGIWTDHLSVNRIWTDDKGIWTVDLYGFWTSNGIWMPTFWCRASRCRVTASGCRVTAFYIYITLSGHNITLCGWITGSGHSTCIFCGLSLKMNTRKTLHCRRRSCAY